MKKIFSIIFFILIFSSCSDHSLYFDKFDGPYAVDELIYNNESYRVYMNPNMLSFNKDKSCELPAFTYDDKGEFGTWDIEMKCETPYVTIVTKFHFFQGTYKIDFDKDYSHLTLISDSVEIYLSKIIE